MWVILFSTLELPSGLRCGGRIPATCHVLGLLSRPWQTHADHGTARGEAPAETLPGLGGEASPHAGAGKLPGAAESDLEGDGACPEDQ